MPNFGWVGVGQALLHQAAHPLRLGRGGAIQRRLPAIGRHAWGRAGHHQRAGARRVTHRKVDRDRAADRSAGQRHLARDAQRVEQRSEVVGHVVERDLALDLLRQPRAARVITQHLTRVVQRRQHLVPAVERTAHLVHQHERRISGAGEFIAQAGAVHLDPVHRGSSLRHRMPHCADGGHRMMKLHWSPRSPYVRKVMVAAHELGLADRLQTVRTVVGGTTPHAELMRENPLGKIPTLVLEDGTILYDSPVICEYLDTLHNGPKLFPAWPERLTALRRLALGDGMLDIALAWLGERSASCVGGNGDGSSCGSASDSVQVTASTSRRGMTRP
jgi:hypothetical protein